VSQIDKRAPDAIEKTLMPDLTDHLALVVTAWAAVGAAVAAFVAVFVAHRATNSTIREAKIATSYQLVNQIDERWNSAAMLAKRQRAAALLLPGQPLPTEDGLDDVIDVFETLALCVDDGVIPFKLATHFFGHWVVNYWFAASARINHVRASDPGVWEDLATLVPLLLRISRAAATAPSPK
jgi:hypothetical protein